MKTRWKDSKSNARRGRCVIFQGRNTENASVCSLVAKMLACLVERNALGNISNTFFLLQRTVHGRNSCQVGQLGAIPSPSCYGHAQAPGSCATDVRGIIAPLIARPRGSNFPKHPTKKAFSNLRKRDLIMNQIMNQNNDSLSTTLTYL